MAVGIVAFATRSFGQDVGNTELSGKIDLLRIVDLAAQRLALNIEYDAAALQQATVTLRIDRPLSDIELWDVANQLLASRGFTSIHSARTDAADVISIVKIPDAAGLARIERDLSLPVMAGFVTVMVPIQHRSLKEIAASITMLLSKPGGAIQELEAESAILVSDLRPRAKQIVEIIQAMDAPSQAQTVESVTSQHVPAANLAALVLAATTALNAMAARPLQGKLTAVPDSNTIVIIAPAHELDRWRDMIERFDRPSEVETRTYSAGSLAMEDVGRLIQDTSRDMGPRGSGDRWRMVSDPFGGLLIVTATPAEHQQVEALISRLNALPAEARRPVRSFPIRNRGVNEIVEVLTKMLEAGVLEGADLSQAARDAPVGPSQIAPDQLQRSPPTNVPVPPNVESDAPSTTAPSLPLPPVMPATATSGRGVAAHPNEPQQTARALIITADEATNTLIAVGEPRRLAQLEELLRTIDVRQPQVMIEVLVVSLSDGDTLDLGVELQKIEVSGDTVITLSSLFGLMPPGATTPTGRGFSGLILNPGDFRVLIRALQTLNEGRSLNMPRVLVSNNQQANLDAVVQQPFVSTNASDTVATTSFGGFENAGTTITVKPQIARGDHLVLEYSASLSAFVGESSDPGIPPPRQQNNLQSVVTVPDGYTVVVGGIEVETKANAVSQVPLIGDIPFIGEVFKSRSVSSSRSRFFVFIRPTVLRQEGFEDLKYLSDVAKAVAEVDDGFPEVEPRIIK